ncbi:hypothetical protein EOD41_04440 [Mucilaginibacter limnophilus]|uniref:Uncharacterized protein n=1 Tax=Mucilaginibacter limnophilus TaxID=1932778 RepID=A0A437MU85_9SPHI|nr:hypothetical protein [Mucilaginibacter limnophilus]RVU01220.1 hypothetical protein EOD41_04440 [Mucilaginibacter limnophilus]
MKRILSKNQYEYMSNGIKMSMPYLINKIDSQVVNDKVIINVSEDVACGIRDWAMDRQVRVGFDENYSLTDEGQILNDLIDVFYE